MTGKFHRLVLLGTAFGVPLFFVPNVVFELYSLPKLAFLIAGLGLALAFLLVDLVVAGGKHSFTSLWLPATALIFALGIAWAWSPYREWALFGQYARFNGLLPYAFVAVLGILIADSFSGRSLALSRGLTVVAGTIGTYTFVQALGLDPFWSPGQAGGDYPPATIGHFNFLGGFLGMCLPLCVYTWAKDARFRMWGLWATTTVTAGLLLANSQGGWAAGVAGTSVMAGSLLRDRYGWAGRAGFVGAAIVGCLIVAAVVASSILPQVGPLGGTIRQRSRLWSTALQMGADSPVVGRGPGAYSVEGVRYRSLASILAERDTTFDEPHSVPLSFWANAGAVGVIGFLVFAGWIIAKGWRIEAGDHLSAAFFAACTAYLVQSLVSIDHLALRSTLWVAMAGLVTTIRPHKPASSSESAPPTGSLKQIAGGLAALVIAGAGLYCAGHLLLADHQAESGREHFIAGEGAEGVLEFERAASFRFEPQYLNLYAHALGVVGLDRGTDGDELIGLMKKVYSYLDRFPDVPGIVDEARILHFWGRFEPSGNLEARRLLERARSLDPHNPSIDVFLSEVLIDLGMTEQARLVLEPWAPALDGHLPDYWGALSIARLLDGQPDEAETALEEGLSLASSNCRVLIARELLRHHRIPSIPVELGTTLALRSACGEGGYQFFLAHLPPETETP